MTEGNYLPALPFSQHSPKQTWPIRDVLRDFQCQKANSGKCNDYSARKESTIKMTITSPILQFANFSSAPTILKH